MHKILTLIALLGVAVALFLLFGREQEPTLSSTQATSPTASDDTPPFVIVAFGDSLTAGYGVAMEESYPSILERRLIESGKHIQVINMGVSGETSQGARERVDFVLEQDPDLIILGIGANDMLRALPVEDMEKNMAEIITEIRKKETPILLLGMKSVHSNGTEYRKAFDAVYQNLSSRYSLSLVPFFLEGVVLRPSLNIADGIHPNKTGYEKIVDENILPTLLPLLKKLGL